MRMIWAKQGSSLTNIKASAELCSENTNETLHLERVIMMKLFQKRNEGKAVQFLIKRLRDLLKWTIADKCG